MMGRSLGGMDLNVTVELIPVLHCHLLGVVGSWDGNGEFGRSVMAETFLHREKGMGEFKKKHHKLPKH